LRNLARAEGMWCSFDPILKRGHAGTGLHFHFSPVVDGQHQPARDGDGRLTDPARWLIAALVRHGAALMAFGNRLESSFIRIGQAKEAPSELTWGEFDRNALVRLPVVARDPEGHAVSPPTIEFRLPDGSAHPHLLLAGVAQAMAEERRSGDLDTLLEATASHGAPAARDAATVVPQSFAGIAAELDRHRAAYEAGGVFPAVVIDAVVERLARAGG
jgi:glutamine synthetase